MKLQRVCGCIQRAYFENWWENFEMHGITRESSKGRLKEDRK
jgi:hypothetical protein